MKHDVRETKVLGTVTSDEAATLRRLYERRNGLLELFKVLPDLSGDGADALYGRIVKDLGEVMTGYEEWWNGMSRKYGWENTKGKSWEIDFESREVLLRNEREGKGVA
jgi:CXXX repeat modification system protein